MNTKISFIQNQIIDLPIQPWMLWLIIVFSILFFLIITFVLRYHWNYYGVEKESQQSLVKFLFFVLPVFLIILMALSAISFESLFL